MARCGAGGGSRGGRVPRERGDGPPRAKAAPPVPVCSPRARGWPASESPELADLPVFPASAGMARCAARFPYARKGVPRERGDGPLARAGAISARQCSPRARGWPVELQRGSRRGPVFPASAGMARASEDRAPDSTRVPRERGDGPPTHSRSLTSQACSPRARGWPVEMAEWVATFLVFPASAGMARSATSCHRQRSGVPRERGDGPEQVRVTPKGVACSPRARGWPGNNARFPLIGRVFPASAGMARRQQHGLPGRGGVPRERGDGPARLTRHDAPVACSPRARGWPVVHSIKGFDGNVFPASAGMARINKPKSFIRSGVPRERGDGP